MTSIDIIHTELLYLHVYSPKWFGQETAKGSLSLRVRLLPVYHTRQQLHTVVFIAEI